MKGVGEGGGGRESMLLYRFTTCCNKHVGKKFTKMGRRCWGRGKKKRGKGAERRKRSSCQMPKSLFLRGKKSLN